MANLLELSKANAERRKDEFGRNTSERIEKGKVTLRVSEMKSSVLVGCTVVSVSSLDLFSFQPLFASP